METVVAARSRRRTFTNRAKAAMIRAVKRKELQGVSQRQACHSLGIDPSNYCKWVKKRDKLQKGNPKAKTLCRGPESVLDEIEEPLLCYIFELREQGMEVKVPMVSIRAQQLLQKFKDKPTREAKLASVRRWMAHHSIVYQMGTHVSQRDPADTANEATDWMALVRRKVVGPNRHKDFIINMDQTPVPFTFNTNKTLERRGAKTVNIRKGTGDTKRVTCALTVTASGRMLAPHLIFKGVSNGRIVKKEIPNYPAYLGIYCSCQAAAWMDEDQMLFWVEKILKPYILTAPDGVEPMLFLDAYRAHMMSSVVDAIQDLGVKVLHIPGGVTSLCQPVDIGVNKPFKNRCREQWEAWMVADDALHGTTKPPERIDIAHWVAEAWGNLPTQFIINSWLHAPYAYFLPTVPTRPPNYEEPTELTVPTVETLDDSDDDSLVSSVLPYIC